MKVQITVNTDNAAFEDNDYELSDILQNVVRKVQIQFLRKEYGNSAILDTNGNAVGEVIITK